MPRNQVEFSLGLAGGDTLPQPADDGVLVQPAILQLRRSSGERQQKVSAKRILHRLGHHASHGVRMLVQHDLLAENAAVEIEVSLPEGIGQDDDLVAPGQRLVLTEEPAQCSTGPQHGEEAG